MRVRSTTSGSEPVGESVSRRLTSLYPALARLEKSGCITSKWEPGDRGREMRMYRLTARGRKQLAIEQSRWDVVVRAMARVLKPV